MQKRGPVFLQKKGIKYLLVALLAVVMVAGYVVERSQLTLAGEGEAEPAAPETHEVIEAAPAPVPQEQRVTQPEVVEAPPAPVPEAPAPEAAPAPEVTEAPAPEAATAPEVTEAPATEVPVAQEPTPEAAQPEQVVVESAEEQLATPEPTLEPEATEEILAEEVPAGFNNAAEDESFRAGYAYTLGDIAVNSEWKNDDHVLMRLPADAVIRVTGRVTQKRGEEEIPWMAVRVAAVNDKGDLEIVNGFTEAWNVNQLPEADYNARKALPEEDSGRIEVWQDVPVVRVGFTLPEQEPVAETTEVTPDETEQPVEEAGKPAPSVEVRYEYDGEELTVGSHVTLYADLHNMPEGKNIQLQWKNNATGEYEAVPGANGQSFSYKLDQNNLAWKWIVEVTIED